MAIDAAFYSTQRVTLAGSTMPRLEHAARWEDVDLLGHHAAFEADVDGDLPEGAVILIIAHRLSTIGTTGRIPVLHKGHHADGAGRGGNVGSATTREKLGGVSFT